MVPGIGLQGLAPGLAAREPRVVVQALLDDDGNDAEARQNMLRAAYCAGIAFTESYVGYVHGLAHALGGHSNLPHGVCNALLLPYVLEFSAEHSAEARDRMPRISRALSMPDERPYTLVRAIRTTAVELGIPRALKEMNGVSPADFGPLADLALKDACMADHLYIPTRDEVIGVYENAWNGQ